MNIDKKTFDEAKTLAASWQKNIEKNRIDSEKKFHAIMKRLLSDSKNKIFLIELLDQSFRSLDNNRIANQLEYNFNKYNNTTFFTKFEQLLVSLFRNLGIYFPSISIPLFIAYLRDDVKNIVIKGEDASLNAHLQKRLAQKTRVNINIIGEAVLGEAEAKERVEKYISLLQNPNIDYVSIKISTIFSQINPISHHWSIEQISLRLQKIYRAAIQNNSKFINLDMEEYRDINLTIDVFIKTLSLDEFKNLHAGIVLQAYIPETMTHLKKLYEWAKRRVDDGGASIKVRLVKGANQEMELTEASLRDWECVTYLDKAQSDANFKLLMDFLIDKEVSPYIHVGIASHNLFDQALGYILAKQRGVLKYFSAEMLEGMSETAYHILKQEDIKVILYAPTATSKTFTNAIAYLVRRFDENTAQQNFLRHSFGLKVGSEAWAILLKSYEDSIDALNSLPKEPYRKQDRNTEVFENIDNVDGYIFKNESDTDFTLTQNQIWADKIRDKYKNISKEEPLRVHIVVGGKELMSQEVKEVMDKSQNITLHRCFMAGEDVLKEAIEVAKSDVDAWSELTLKERTKVLMNVANEFRKNRGLLIGIAAAELGKIFSESDVEISEAIDFLNFYPYSLKKLNELDGIKLEEKGVGLVISPWNFPIAIAVGGVAAALACGNRVILKPSSDALLCGYMLCKCFWDAGVSKNTLQFIPTQGELAGEFLLKSKDIDFVIFTGSEKTAYKMLKNRPEIHLSAETGGKDATIVTALSDRDQAIKNVVASAFNNSGQKCSATSLLILEREVYEDEEFKKMLIDATLSLHVGSVWDTQNRISSLVNIPSGNLKYALEHLDDGEEWLIAPSFEDSNPYMLKPSIRWGTKKGDFCHMNELFGPVLSVMCAEDLDDALSLVNSTGYGLTSGIESLDEREVLKFKENLMAGNLYINRMTTGAVVLRQPFGGMGKSAIGSGKKAGGFNYVSQFVNISCDFLSEQKSAPHPYLRNLQEILKDEDNYRETLEKSIKTIGNFAYHLKNEFLQEHDYSNIRGQSNINRYLHVKKMMLVIDTNDALYEILCSIAAAKLSRVKLHVSLPKELYSDELLWLISKKTLLLDEHDSLACETLEESIESMRASARVRYLSKENIRREVYEQMAKDARHIASEPFIPHGRVELMHYFLEQSISHNYHRYGNIGLYTFKKKEEK
ncbi:delta-1-pyrroline-5-carboxylate dehydrogenase / L-proline dehydrogenase [Sulfurimonas denitrificans DSM 1251]|uniref:L-glutamate gamma-semialdehyde dehydrogenase n=1 Tax=Sulfurimonas denitrificans (strain ATCC 33889 / DSM 1251) TaxID=326298 RepID=Q30QX6_SULDN|nr:bifunctional proline dehydrogenase/L-glutamate gamma-semialdehyde dehydrogenase [Sulfurimonas denitrificans]ABB44605.1 delta-1-pyrroline-5-carboxylate dehydrogenase / L-proline dehydrogenase [Sulfurimonas denitrificans DSM 1251]